MRLGSGWSCWWAYVDIITRELKRHMISLSISPCRHPGIVLRVLELWLISLDGVFEEILLFRCVSELVGWR
jgi:hypothetical protein